MTEKPGPVPFRRAAWDKRLREIRKRDRPARPSGGEERAPSGSEERAA